MADGNEQYLVAVEVFVWADSYEQAREELKHGLSQTVFDYAIEEVS